MRYVNTSKRWRAGAHGSAIIDLHTAMMARRRYLPWAMSSIGTIVPLPRHYSVCYVLRWPGAAHMMISKQGHAVISFSCDRQVLYNLRGLQGGVDAGAMIRAGNASSRQ